MPRVAIDVLMTDEASHSVKVASGTPMWLKLLHCNQTAIAGPDLSTTNTAIEGLQPQVAICKPTPKPKPRAAPRTKEQRKKQHKRTKLYGMAFFRGDTLDPPVRA